MLPQHVRGRGDLGAAGLVDFEFAVTAIQRLPAGADNDVSVVVFQETGIGRKPGAWLAAEQLVDRQALGIFR